MIITMTSNKVSIIMLSRLIRPEAASRRACKILRQFSGGHPKEYDWRDDPTYNPDLIYNPR